MLVRADFGEPKLRRANSTPGRRARRVKQRSGEHGSIDQRHCSPHIAGPRQARRRGATSFDGCNFRLDAAPGADPVFGAAVLIQD